MIGAPLSSALAARRAEYNRRFAEAQRRRRALEGAAFAAYLEQTVDPVAAAVAAIEPGAVDEAVDCLFELGLDLLPQGWLGPQARDPRLPRLWRDLLVAFAPQLAQAPTRLAGGWLNALHQLAALPRFPLERWPEALMGAAGPHTPIDQLLDLGRLAAWGLGAAHQRQAALAAAPRLPPAAVAAALGLPAPLPVAAWPALTACPTATPADWLAGGPLTLAPLGWVGGFSGYGGPFRRKPWLGVVAGRLVAGAQESAYAIHADGYGATLVAAAGPAGPVPPPALPPGVEVGPGGIAAGGARLADPDLTEPAQAAATGGLLAVSLRHSFRIALYRLPGLNPRTGGSA